MAETGMHCGRELKLRRLWPGSCVHRRRRWKIIQFSRHESSYIWLGRLRCCCIDGAKWWATRRWNRPELERVRESSRYTKRPLRPRGCREISSRAQWNDTSSRNNCLSDLEVVPEVVRGLSCDNSQNILSGVQGPKGWKNVTYTCGRRNRPIPNENWYLRVNWLLGS